MHYVSKYEIQILNQMSARYQLKVCHYLGGGGSRQTVTKCDKGRRGSKIGGRPVTYFLNGP